MSHIDKTKATQQPDGSVLVEHENGAKHVIPALRYRRWALSELKASMKVGQHHEPVQKL